jgi:hypothetical protein
MIHPAKSNPQFLLSDAEIGTAAIGAVIGFVGALVLIFWDMSGLVMQDKGPVAKGTTLLIFVLVLTFWGAMAPLALKSLAGEVCRGLAAPAVPAVYGRGDKTPLGGVIGGIIGFILLMRMGPWRRSHGLGMYLFLILCTAVGASVQGGLTTLAGLPCPYLR